MNRVKFFLARAWYIIQRAARPLVWLVVVLRDWLDTILYRYAQCGHRRWNGTEWRSIFELVEETKREDGLLDMGWHGKHERCAACGRNRYSWEPI